MSRGSKAVPGPPPGIVFGPASLPSIRRSAGPRGGPRNPGTVRVGAVSPKASLVTRGPFQPFPPRRKRRILLNTLEGGVIAS